MISSSTTIPMMMRVLTTCLSSHHQG
jgi:hypothetical protein